MNASKVFAALAVFTLVSLTASSAYAQRGGRGQARGQAVQRAPVHQAPRGAPPAHVAPGPPPGAQRPAAPGVAVPRTAPPYQSHYYGRPGYSYPQPYSYARRYPYAPAYSYGHYPSYGSRYYAPRYGYGYGGYYGGHYGGYYGAYYYRPYYYPRPYYSFSPWFSIGFGISMGYPIAYPSYPYVYPYAAYPAPYAPTVVATPGAAAYGGVSFQVTPSDAVVYVDGNYVGPVGYFGPNAQPLTLTPGTHHIEVQAPGYQPISFDVNIVPGQVIPYSGTMLPY